LLNRVNALEIYARKDLLDRNKLAAESVTGNLDRLIHSLEVSVVVTNAGVEVVVDNIWGVKRICRFEGHGASSISRMSLEQSPGKPVVMRRRIDRVAGEISS
jgi:hypothetical protein